MQSLFYGASFVIAAFSSLGIYVGGAWSWSGFLILFVLVSFLETVFKDLSIQSSLSKSDKSDLWIFVSPFYLTAILIQGTGAFLGSTSTLEKWGLVLSVASLLGGFGITMAHELVHRPQGWQRALGLWNLLLVQFGHWGIEHVFGHHKHVATPMDPATAKKNQNLYSFWIQDYFGGLASAWSFETYRLKNSPWKWIQNRVLNYSLFSICMILFVGFFVSWVAASFWLMVSAVSILLLLSVDYIEHYGLSRRLRENGMYEPVKSHHSWDCELFFTNVILVNLGLHAHHHAKARLTFQGLESQSGSLKMPFGYPVMVTLALVPPLFFKIMNPKLEFQKQPEIKE